MDGLFSRLGTDGSNSVEELKEYTRLDFAVAY